MTSEPLTDDLIARSRALAERADGPRMIPEAEPALFDKRGIPIERGDIVRVYHFTAARRRKKYYMYKQALGIRQLPKCGLHVVDFSHLNMCDESYTEWADGRILADYEIVQSAKCDHEQRSAKAALPVNGTQEIDHG